jgi:opacity protein-like surface antigen
MRTCFTAVAVAVAGVVAFAAIPAGAVIPVGRLDAGVRAGVNLSNVSIDDTELSDTANGLYLGAIAGLGVAPLLSVETGVVWSSKGGEGLGFETNLDYVSIPLRGRVPLSNAPVQPYFLLGMEFSFLARAERTSSQVTEDVKDRFRSFDYGLGAGIGMEIPVMSALVVFEYTWTRGLTDIFEETGTEGHNRTSQLVGGLKYRFDKRLF